MSTRKLPRAPLILVLAEVHFSPVLTMGQSIPAMQDQLRKMGFPEYDTVRVNADTEWPDTVENIRWCFASKDNRTAIVLAVDHFVVETSTYSVFEDFLKLVRTISDIVSEAVSPELLRRVSLRYIDLIRDIDNKKARDLIKSTVPQLDIPQIAAGDFYRYVAAQYTTPLGLVRVNAMESSDEMFTPPDVDPVVETSVELKENERKIILDIDHIVFFEEDAFSTETICQAYIDTHRENVRPTFEAVVTSEALQIWGKVGE